MKKIILFFSVVVLLTQNSVFAQKGAQSLSTLESFLVVETSGFPSYKAKVTRNFPIMGGDLRIRHLISYAYKDVEYDAELKMLSDSTLLWEEEGRNALFHLSGGEFPLANPIQKATSWDSLSHFTLMFEKPERAELISSCLFEEPTLTKGQPFAEVIFRNSIQDEQLVNVEWSTPDTIHVTIGKADGSCETFTINTRGHGDAPEKIFETKKALLVIHSSEGGGFGGSNPGVVVNCYDDEGNDIFSFARGKSRAHEVEQGTCIVTSESEVVYWYDVPTPRKEKGIVGQTIDDFSASAKVKAQEAGQKISQSFQKGKEVVGNLFRQDMPAPSHLFLRFEGPELMAQTHQDTSLFIFSNEGTISQGDTTTHIGAIWRIDKKYFANVLELVWSGKVPEDAGTYENMAYIYQWIDKNGNLVVKLQSQIIDFFGEYSFGKVKNKSLKKLKKNGGVLEGYPDKSGAKNGVSLHFISSK